MIRHRFECANRIQFALENERNAHLAAGEQQRQEMLGMFQEERDQLIECQSAALDALQITMQAQCEADMLKRVVEVRDEENLKSLELEMQWKMQEILLQVFIADANKRMDEAVG